MGNLLPKPPANPARGTTGENKMTEERAPYGTQTPTRLMRMSEVLRLTGFKSRSTVYELQANGDFPQAVKLTGKAVGFVESEVHAWIASRIAARLAPEPTPAYRPPRLRHAEGQGHD